MRGVKGSLDIVFLDRDFAVVAITKDVIPETGTATAPPGTAHAAEIKAGGADHYGLTSESVWVELTNAVLNKEF
jgi:uncharacterized membrane protein (UPF0127 family)